jgi:probable O-glycosylation ligase (exosortase A-associated)
MAQILLYILLAGNALVAPFVPWIGVLAYYTVSVYNPAAVWYWVFGDMRYAVYTSVPVLIGFVVLSLRQKISLARLWDRQNLYLLILWLSAVLSYLFSPFGHNTQTASVVFNSEYIVTTFTKVLLFYFISIMIIDTRRKLFYLTALMLFTIIYYTYWANDQYLRFGLRGGRLPGPGTDITAKAIYTDENCFAMLFVVGIPFLYYFGMHYKNWILKVALLLCIPFAWHAIFLTSSRGGLVGLAAVSLYIWVRSRHRILGIAILAALVAAFVFQGGSLRERSKTIVDYEEDGSAMSRIYSWKAGFSMMLDHPITGVGIGNFMVAYPSYSDLKPKVAHNSVVQLGAETGVVAAIAYLCIFIDILIRRRRTNKNDMGEIDPLMMTIREAVDCSLFGFFVCSMFLSISNYEVFYFVLLMRAAWWQIIQRQSPAKQDQAPDMATAMRSEAA